MTEVASEPNAAVIGDVTGDGLSDVVVATGTGYGSLENHVLVFRQNESGQLESYGQYPYGQFAGTNGLELLNLDGANALDVAVGGHAGVTFVRSQPNGTMLASAPVIAKNTRFLTELDVNRDALADLVARGFDGGHIQINNGDGTTQFVDWPALLGLEGSIAAGDLDKDGYVDIVAAGGQGVQIFMNTGAVPPALTQQLTAQCDSRVSESVSLGDVDADGVLDIIASVNAPSACVIVFYGTGGGQFLSPGVPYVSYNYPQVSRSVDVDRDGLEDIVTLHGGWLTLGLYLQQPNGTLAPQVLFPLPYSSHYWPESLAIGDVSGDECPDVVIADGLRGILTLKGSRCFTLFLDGFE